MPAKPLQRLRRTPVAPFLYCAAAICLVALAILPTAAQIRPAGPEAGTLGDLPYFCPMDPDIRSSIAGNCSRCGMALVLGLPDMEEYPVLLTTDPPAVEPEKRVQLRLEVLDPRTGERQTGFETVHEKLLHLFWVSHDLEEFRHVHPKLGRDGVFRLGARFPRPGSYRLMADFYPSGGTPQMMPLTLTTRGFEEPLETLRAQLGTDRAPKSGRNVTVSLRTEPAEPLAGLLTLLFFELDTARGLQKFLGAWAHMLAVKDDLVTMIHGHPTIADGGTKIQMNVIFPEPGMYRIWFQAQRRGKVNTVPFTIEVSGIPR